MKRKPWMKSLEVTSCLLSAPCIIILTRLNYIYQNQCKMWGYQLHREENTLRSKGSEYMTWWHFSQVLCMEKFGRTRKLKVILKDLAMPITWKGWLTEPWGTLGVHVGITRLLQNSCRSCAFQSFLANKAFFPTVTDSKSLGTAANEAGYRQCDHRQELPIVSRSLAPS